MVHVREERPDDYAAIRALNDAAFGQPQEGLLVDALRMNGGVMLSLVAEQDGLVVGHILYSPATIDTEGRRVAGASLGPMAVLPAYQHRGVGGQLIEAGTRWLKRRGCPFIIVLGHPGYYPRFGFRCPPRRAKRGRVVPGRRSIRADGWNGEGGSMPKP